MEWAQALPVFSCLTEFHVIADNSNYIITVANFGYNPLRYEARHTLTPMLVPQACVQPSANVTKPLAKKAPHIHLKRSDPSFLQYNQRCVF